MLVVFFCHPPLFAGTDLGGLVARLDKIRIPENDLASKLEVRHSLKPAQPPETSAFRIFTRVSGVPGRQKIATLMVCTDPPKDAGKRVLFLDEACWFFDPRAKRPAKISPAQLWSQPAASDSPNWRLAGDFSAALAGKETIPCGDGVKRNCAVIDFVPASMATPAPARMRYWVDDDGKYWRVEHFTASGRLFKTIDNVRYERVAGSDRAVGMRIRSGPETAEATFSGIEARSSPRAWFEPDGLAQVPP